MEQHCHRWDSVGEVMLSLVQWRCHRWDSVVVGAVALSSVVYPLRNTNLWALILSAAMMLQYDLGQDMDKS